MKYTFTLLLSIAICAASAQTTIAGHDIPSDNFYVIRDYINANLRQTTTVTHNEQDSKGDQLFDRWINYWESHVNPDGSFPAPDYTSREMARYRQAHPARVDRSTGNPAYWTQMPVSYASNAPGIGRVDRVTINPRNPNHLYVSTPSGSFWESADGATTWHPRTDQLPIIGLSGIVLDPNDSNIIYIATGDGEANADNPSLGVLKSYDGGRTWGPTGLTFTYTGAQKYISRLEMNPTNPAQLLVAASNGIYLTQDSGVTWVSRRGGNFRDVKYMPRNGAVAYAVTATGFVRSIDSGKTWVSVSAGIPTTGNRMSLAVTPAAPARVYLISGGTNGLVGVYMSNDTGKTWTTQTTTPNLLGYFVDGSDQFSQSWYTLALAASPTDPNLLFSGGANVWSSNDAGASWTCQTNTYAPGYGRVHVDIHELRFTPDGTGLYVGCDGGLYYHTVAGSNWDYVSNGLENTQVYRIAVSDGDTSITMYGAQDNDVVIDINGSCDGLNVLADGFGCAIDPVNSNILFAESQYGAISNSYDEGVNWSNETLNGTQNASWDAPFRMNNQNPSELFAGLDHFYHTTNGGGTWTQLGDLANSNNYFKNFAFCESNTQVMYATYGSGVYKTTDGGTTWTVLTSPALSGLGIEYIEVHPDDPDRVWVTISGYRAGMKVFYSDDGGVTFYNISGSLPNISANTIVYQKGSNDVIYVGMDNGVYVYGDTLSDFVLYADNLPNAIVKELKIRYATSELFAGTYGRGVWKTKLYQRNPTGIATVPDLHVAIYPNPVTSELIVESKNSTSSDATITISDISGQQIRSIQSDESRTIISCSDLSPGIYFVSYQLNGTKLVRKFVKL